MLDILSVDNQEAYSQDKLDVEGWTVLRVVRETCSFESKNGTVINLSNLDRPYVVDTPFDTNTADHLILVNIPVGGENVPLVADPGNYYISKSEKEDLKKSSLGKYHWFDEKGELHTSVYVNESKLNKNMKRRFRKSTQPSLLFPQKLSESLNITIKVGRKKNKEFPLTELLESMSPSVDSLYGKYLQELPPQHPLFETVKVWEISPEVTVDTPINSAERAAEKVTNHLTAFTNYLPENSRFHQVNVGDKFIIVKNFPLGKNSYVANYPFILFKEKDQDFISKDRR